MGPEVCEDEERDGSWATHGGRPAGSDHDLDPFLSRRSEDGPSDDIYDGDW
jgi:hypothetical protein